MLICGYICYGAKKVWQELPDTPATDAEMVVADKFRYELGDDLQNAMGLSVTTRLLNLHNPLYVKLHFSGKPEAGCLQSFIREHKMTAFKRIPDSNRDTFAARFDRMGDFDRLCVHSEVKCGSATVAITPCYKYMACPPTVKSIYADNIARAQQATLPSMTTNDSTQTKADSDKKITAETAEVKTNNAKAVEKKVNTEIGKSETVPQGVTTGNKTATIVSITKEAVVYTKTVKKPTPETKVPAKEVPTEAKKVTPKKVENKTEPEKVIPKKVENKTEPEKVIPKKVENTTEPKVTPKKVDDKNEVKKNDIVDKIKDKGLEAVAGDMMVVDEMAEEGDEEMTDQDILALMSGGIVLDECSGSEDEK